MSRITCTLQNERQVHYRVSMEKKERIVPFRAFNNLSRYFYGFNKKRIQRNAKFLIQFRAKVDNFEAEEEHVVPHNRRDSFNAY